MPDFGNERCRYQCNQCRAKANRARLQKQGALQAFYKKHNVRKYGIELDDVKRMEAEQDFCCAICGERKPLSIDHNHATGKVRGLLCCGCNAGLGNFADRPDLFLKAIDYVKRDGTGVVTTP
jgi:hypothetical protein